MDAGLITTFHPFLNIDRSPDLERLFRDSAADLAGFFARRNEGKEQADDLVQETFLRMAEVLEKGKRPDNLRAYLFGIARHVSQAAWRRSSREPEVADAVEIETIAAAHPRDDRVDAAGEMIEQLPALQREIRPSFSSFSLLCRNGGSPGCADWNGSVSIAQRDFPDPKADRGR